MKKQKNVMVIAVIILLVAALAVIIFVKQIHSGNDSKKTDTEHALESEKKDQDRKPDNQSDSQSDGQSDGEIKDGDNIDISDSGKKVPKVITFPYKIKETGLEVQQVASYDGVFLEDGSDSDISGVAVVVLKNTGKSAIGYTEVKLVRGDATLLFKASAIPAGATVVVQESNKSSYVEGDYTACDAEVAYIDKLEMSEKQVEIKDNGDNSLTVTNLTDKDIAAVRVFYKFYMENEKTYVGGIAYNAKASGLKAKKSINLKPIHYASGPSKVIMVRTYDTVD